MTLTLADVVKEINIMIEASAEPSKPTVDAIFSLCLKSGWGYREDNVPHKSVAWHDSNRFGAGIDAIDLHGLLDNIIDQSKGWSWPSCGVGRAFEKAPTGTERHAAQVAKINECIEAADGYLPNLKEYDVRILSVANTHTEGVCSSIYHQTKGNQEKYCTSGRIDKEKMFRLVPSFRKPVEVGLPWEIIKHEIEAAIPTLPLYIQEAENLNHGSQREETKVQTMFRLHAQGLMYSSAGKDIPWAKIGEDAERAKPILKGHAKGLCSFVNTFAGGDDPKLLKRLDKFSKYLKVRRDLPGAVLGVIGNATKLLPFPEYARSIVMAMLVSPVSFTKNSTMSTLMTGVDINALLEPKKLYTKLVEAEAVLTKAEEIVHKLPGDHERLVDELGIELVMCIHKKTSKTRNVFPTIAACKAEFASKLTAVGYSFEEWHDKSGSAISISAKEVKKAAESAASPLIDYSDLRQTLLAKGFKQGGGAMSTKKAEKGKDKHESEKEKAHFIIGSIDNECGASLQEWDVEKCAAKEDSDIINVQLIELLTDYKPVTIYHKELWKYCDVDVKACDMLDYQLEVVKSTCRVALDSKFQLHKSTSIGDALAVEALGKTKKVVATQTFKKDELVLVPLSMVIAASVQEKVQSCAKFKLLKNLVNKKGEVLEIYAQKQVDYPEPKKETNNSDSSKQVDKRQFIVPFWHVRPSGDKKVANMQMCLLDASDLHVKVPAMKNTKKIEADSEVVVFDPALVEEEAEDEEPALKKKKTTHG